MAKDYQRPKSGFTFAFNGMKTNAAPETIPPDKCALAINVRGYADTHLRTRPGFAQRFTTANSPVTDLATFAALSTDNLPRVVARLADDTLWLDTGAQVGTLAGGGSSPAATMIPFRPDQSPQPFLYIANGSDYQKLSAPSSGGSVVAQKVGIAEPPTAPEATLVRAHVYEFSADGGDYTRAGTAGATSNSSRITDTVVSTFPDPASINLFDFQTLTIGVGASQVYTKQMSLAIRGISGVVVQDVFPAQPGGSGIDSIYYFAGTTGRCIIVPSSMGPGPGLADESIYIPTLISSLRRGSLIKFAGGTVETCYVLSVSIGPDGTICIETTTNVNHTAAESFTCPAAVQIGFPPSAFFPGIVIGNSIASAIFSSTLTGSGIGTLTAPLGGSQPFVASNVSYQADDYLHISVKVATLASLTEMKVLIDVGDGTFTQNFYYYTVRASDVTAAVQNTLTQLGAAQLVTQRRIIDEEHAAATGNQLATSSSAQTMPGDGQWAEIVFPVRELTRVGNDQTKTLQGITKIQFLFNTSATTIISVGISTVWGGYQPDVGPAGAPYQYRVRPRSSLTGAKGNPSPATRYGVNPRRTEVLVVCPSSTYDLQIDTWDVFRYGGTVTSWRKIGQQSLASGSRFIDNYPDEVAAAGEPLDFDNHEPWSSIDVPLNVTGVSVIGTTAVAGLLNPGSVLRLLPGNLVRIGSTNVYTLRTRPTLISGSNYLFQFEENAGTVASGNLLIYEPAIARQFLPYMWGPDSYGTVFGCGDALRPGTISFAKPNAPDAAPDRFNLEIVQPSEPLLGGEVLDGLSFVASTERWWALYPQLSNPVQRYAPIQQPIPRGLAAPYGHCTDGREIYFWAKDGIWSHRQGSLTDADLFNIFPHEGVPGEVVTLYGYTVQPPDYSRAGTFRLVCANGYLYALYKDLSGVYRVLTYDLRRKAWALDNYQYLTPIGTQLVRTDGLVSALCHVAQQEGSVLSQSTTNPMLLAGTLNGQVGGQSDLTNDFGTSIAAAVSTFEWDGGDLRFGGSIWGDAVLDATMPASGGLTATLVQEQQALLPGITLPQRATRDQNILSLGGGLVANFLGVALQWTDDYTTQVAPTELHLWQPSFLDKPETIADRFTDWDDAGSVGNKWWQGFVLQADTEGADKLLAVRDADTLALHTFTPVVNHATESQRAYSFDQPFLAHSVRIEPQDQIPWRFYAAVWVTEPSPEMAETWQTQGTSHEMPGYQHVKQVSVAYAATQPITLTITSFDGQSPAAITLPATGGAMQKVTRQLTPNKGQLYFYKASSAAAFQLFLPDWEILVGAWQRGDAAYTRYQTLGGAKGDQAKI